jgi:hypothetical protein
MNIESRSDRRLLLLSLQAFLSVCVLCIEKLTLALKGFFYILSGKRLVAELRLENFDVLGFFTRSDVYFVFIWLHLRNEIKIRIIFTKLYKFGMDSNDFKKEKG